MLRLIVKVAAEVRAVIKADQRGKMYMESVNGDTGQVGRA